MSTTYTVTATRWAGGWELDIEGVGVTQARTLNEANVMVRDYIRLDLGDEALAAAEISLQAVVEDVTPEVERVKREMAEAQATQERLAAENRGLARALKDRGLSGADGAVVMGVSEQRFSQLVHG